MGVAIQVGGIVFLLACGGIAKADDIYVIETQPDYSYLRDAGKKDMENAGKNLANIVKMFTQKSPATKLVLTIKCERFVDVITVYANGNIKQTSMDAMPVDRTDLAAAQAAIPILQVIEGGCVGS